MSLDFFVQAWVLCSGASAMWILSTPFSEEHRRLGCLIGLAGQPVWLINTFYQAQWGMFVLSLIITISYIRGVLHRTSSGEFQ